MDSLPNTHEACLDSQHRRSLTQSGTPVIRHLGRRIRSSRSFSATCLGRENSRIDEILSQKIKQNNAWIQVHRHKVGVSWTWRWIHAIYSRGPREEQGNLWCRQSLEGPKLAQERGAWSLFLTYDLTSVSSFWTGTGGMMSSPDEFVQKALDHWGLFKDSDREPLASMNQRNVRPYRWWQQWPPSSISPNLPYPCNFRSCKLGSF